ncbi:MAG: DUF5990 family protein, partial [Anaerolineae bacterium]|nr:DUF5990 family protein [Anaerolineae bacterium]
VHLYILCTHPPDAYEFGLQDKNGALLPGTAQPDGSLLYTCTLNVQVEGERVNFTGAYAHGTPADRFLYLSTRGVDGAWVRRIKIPLSGITPAQIDSGESLATTVDGRAAARVKVAWSGRT